MDPASDSEELQLLTESLRTTMNAASGARLDAALVDFGWHDILGDATNPRAAVAGMVMGGVAIVAGLIAIGYYAWLDSQDAGRLQ
ncbi:hypothetical protein [Mycobacterium tilburgii]|uniref:hypothetical protein n=1 Tax=Mycobacterium tilburgii TaxID=44467 RepID=UPI001642DCA5